MDILIPDEWLREHLKTKATPKQIMEKLSLCGPSIEKITGSGKNTIYHIEVTTNRMDTASVRGIAREAAAILPRFGIEAQLKPIKLTKIGSTKKLDINIKNNSSLCKRILAVKIENTLVAKSPQWLADRLVAVGQRPINNVIDITNYLMWELGHPVHVFDYDRLVQKTIVVREADKGEKLITLDDKEWKMEGGEVVFDDGTGEIIDLPGIIGTKNTVVTKNTKNILLWIESIDPYKIRKTSMAHAIRTQAATLNEKQVDPEIGISTILRGVDMYKKYTKGAVASKMLDINEKPFKPKTLKIEKEFIDQKLGVTLGTSEITSYLKPLGFETKWTKNTLSAQIPSFRSHDISIKEDVIEEIARIYGYHNFPSILMQGAIPIGESNTFDFEIKLKTILKGMGGVEVYTFSLVSEKSDGNSLKLKNPLGKDATYMRTELQSSLVQAVNANSNMRSCLFMFEMANVYLPKKGSLPEEKLILAGIFANHDFREAKGIVEALLDEINIKYEEIATDSSDFAASKRIELSASGKTFGVFGELEDGKIYFEFAINDLYTKSLNSHTFVPIPKYPAQTEDLTFTLPEKSKVGEIIKTMLSTKNVTSVKLGDVYKNNYTFAIKYQNTDKTLTNEDVEKIREEVIKNVEKTYKAQTV